MSKHISQAIKFSDVLFLIGLYDTAANRRQTSFNIGTFYGTLSFSSVAEKSIEKETKFLDV